VIGFNTVAFLLGMLAFGALGLLWGAPPSPRCCTCRQPAGLAVALLLGLAAFVALCHHRRCWPGAGARRRWHLGLRLPPAGLALAQLAISAVELSASGLALWCLLPENPLPLLSFLALYAVAISAALISHVPGGVGVFEAVMLLAAGPAPAHRQLLGALLLYRGLYYVLPWCWPAACWWPTNCARRGGPMGRAAVRQSPRLLAALTLVAGLWLVVPA
jgi:phosphatidylglycerol lysyltransferase